MANELGRSFDPAARVYAESRALPIDVEDQLVGQLIVAFWSPAPRILDVGAGTGRFAIPFVRATNWRTYALDLGHQMLANLRLVGSSGHLQCVCGDATRLPFISGCFTGAIFSSVLHVVGDWRAVVAETVRCLQEHSKVMILLGRRYENNPPSRQLMIRLQEMLNIPRDTGPRIEEIVQQLANHGFRHKEMAPAAATLWAAPRETLDLIASDAYPFTWDLDPAEKRRVVAELEVWAIGQWRDLDQKLPAMAKWRWQCFTRE